MTVFQQRWLESAAIMVKYIALAVCVMSIYFTVYLHALEPSFTVILPYETLSVNPYFHAYDSPELCVEHSIRLFLGDDDLAFYHGEFDPTFYQDKDRLTRGRVEYCVNQTYHGICGDEWGFTHASVVCRQLGFSYYGTFSCFGTFVLPLCHCQDIVMFDISVHYSLNYVLAL